MRQRYREGQEDQLGALGLVVNIIVLWNTLYIDAAIAKMREEGYQVEPKDVARLSPLVFDRINLLHAGVVKLTIPIVNKPGTVEQERNAWWVILPLAAVATAAAFVLMRHRRSRIRCEREKDDMSPAQAVFTELFGTSLIIRFERAAR